MKKFTYQALRVPQHNRTYFTLELPLRIWIKSYRNSLRCKFKYFVLKTSVIYVKYTKKNK